MESFDQAFKYLAQKNPRDFIRFALENPDIDILEPLPSGLPARRRDIDGCYLIRAASLLSDEPCVAHFEFHRRKQGLDELAVDVTEAQIRLFRREQKRVISVVWDLYGRRDEPFLDRRNFEFGAKLWNRCSQGVYLRVNLRAMDWREFLCRAPPVLWPLIALTRDGDRKEALIEARDAIQAQKNLGFSEQSDYVSILRFVAEAERVPSRLLETLLDQEIIMASGYYQSVIAKGKAQGKVLGFLEGEAQGILKGEAQGILKGEAQGILKGEAQTLATTIVDILERRLGSVEDNVRKRILTETNLDTLEHWKDLAFDALDAESAQKVVKSIRKMRKA